jgi:hypothetical protein
MGEQNINCKNSTALLPPKQGSDAVAIQIRVVFLSKNTTRIRLQQRHFHVYVVNQHCCFYSENWTKQGSGQVDQQCSVGKWQGADNRDGLKTGLATALFTWLDLELAKLTGIPLIRGNGAYNSD